LGRIGYHGNKKSFEHNAHKISTPNIIIMGHHIDEGVLNYFPNHNIQVDTILRDPLDRYISHYNMIKSKENTNLEINQFIKSRGNFICKFLIKRFPSFIDDLMDSLSNQAKSIINKFDNKYFLEDGDVFFNSFLSSFDLKLEKKNIETRRSENYKKFASKKEINSKSNSFIKSDNNLYLDQLNHKNSQTRIKLPIINSIHYWYKDFYSNFISSNNEEYEKNMINSLNDCFLKKIISVYYKNRKITLNEICQIALQNQKEFDTKESMINFQDLIEFIIKQYTTYKIDLTIKNPNSDLEILIKSIVKQSPPSLKALSSKSILLIKYKSANLELACAKIEFKRKKLDIAKIHTLNSISLDALNAQSYYLLHNISKELKDRYASLRSLEKCLELSPNNKKFKETYLKEFKYL